LLTSSIIGLIFIFFLLNNYDIKSSADESIAATRYLSTCEVNSDFVCNELFIDIDFSFEVSGIVKVLSSFEENSILVLCPGTCALFIVINSEFVDDVLLLAFVTFECIEVSSLLDNDLLDLGWLLKVNLDPEIFLFLSGLFTVVET